jgi:hypothetical protein
LKNPLVYLGEGEPNYDLKIMKVRGGKSPRNQRNLVERPKNHLGRAWRRKEVKWRKNR